MNASNRTPPASIAIPDHSWNVGRWPKKCEREYRLQDETEFVY
ncbi:hypothetical protein [Xylella fastidiosa]|nr:hypothetical protein [Xylella fastidiosa]WGZ33297.1 hypothetical protein O4444_04775 [Xylella fastidiosa subsp. pauca]WGZ35618.1 hypothetical protein O4445_06190 [Xylella fastidiosa subsp. pauca]WGZ37896.1 hypothetical protein O4443_06170 [Xylella fastidiosa subsp. pauca]